MYQTPYSFLLLAQALEMLFAHKNSSMGLLQKLTRASRVSKSGNKG
jgi:hypothetical protein